MALVFAAATEEVVLVAVPVLVALAAALVVGAAHRGDTDQAIGLLSRETIRQDRSRPPPPVAPSGREVERSAALARGGTTTALVESRSVSLEAWRPPDPETLGVTRRQFLNRSLIGGATFGLSAFGLSMIGFLWPTSSGGFGAKIAVGSLRDVLDKIDLGDGFAYYPEGRMWITEYPSSALDKARQVYDPSVLAGLEAGIVALYQKCPHLGCRVPNTARANTPPRHSWRRRAGERRRCRRRR